MRTPEQKQATALKMAERSRKIAAAASNRAAKRLAKLGRRQNKNVYKDLMVQDMKAPLEGGDKGFVFVADPAAPGGDKTVVQMAPPEVEP